MTDDVTIKLSDVTADQQSETEVRELIENWAAAVRTRDIDAILSFHSADFVMYDVPEPFESVGLDAYRKTWELFFRFTKSGVFDINELNITAGENVAFAFAKMQCSDKSNGGDFEPLNFRLTVGLKKVNGNWMIIHEHHSLPSQ